MGRVMMQKTSSRTLYDYWNTLRGARSAPDRRDIDPTRIRGALANTFILELNPDGGFNFRLAGSHLCTAYCRELKSRSFTTLWHARDRDALDTLIRAVTEDHAAALITFTATTEVKSSLAFETILLPVRHNGSTQTRILGAMTALESPYWFGAQPIAEQRITGLRLIWPDDLAQENSARDVAAIIPFEVVHAAGNGAPAPIAGRVFGRSARRYAHLAVIDGGRS